MKSGDKDPKTMLEQAVAEIRTEAVSEVELNESAARVHARLEDECSLTEAAAQSKERIEGCSDFQALIPSYLLKHLSPARVTLLEDHMRECVMCRKAMWAARSAKTQKPVVVAAARSPYLRVAKWAVAAGLVIGFGLFQFRLFNRLFWPAPQTRAIVENVEGKLLKVAKEGVAPLSVGQTVERGDLVRTSLGSYAVLKMEDGSVIEIKERSELSLESRDDGATVDLDRGSVIVQAAKQRAGRRLYVDAEDCLVIVKGTVFSVNRGAKGARVSVIEGEVEVRQGQESKLLKPGQQVSTSAALGAAPIEREIAWSRRVDEHVNLLHEFSVVGNSLLKSLASNELRYTSRLLPLVPQNTAVYAALPNFGRPLGDAYELLQQRIQENPELQAWWAKTQAEGDRPGVDEMISRIRRLSEFLGQEVVIAVPAASGGECEPVVLAEVKRPAELRAALEEDLARVKELSKGEAAVQIIDDPAQVPVGEEARRALLIYLGRDVMAISPSPDELRRVASGASADFTETEFYRRLTQTYSDGVDWMLAVDLERLKAEKTAQVKSEASEAVEERLGLKDIQQLIVEQKTVAGKSQSRAVLSFNQPRRGMTAWLAAPGPMGALDFVSPDAFVAACFLAKDPAAMLDELFEAIQSSDAGAWQEIVDFQIQQGINLRDDIAVPLGGEFVVAVDGPLLPEPSWKVVIQVDDPGRFQTTLEQLLATVNQKAREEGKEGLTLQRDNASGTTFYRVTEPERGKEVNYVYWDGYLLMAPSRALLIQALQYRDTGYTLPRSAAFRNLLPAGGQENCSALAYQNLLPMVGSLAQYIPEKGTPLSAEQVEKLKKVAAEAPPTLICACGEKDRIVLAGTGLPGLNLATLASLGQLGDLLEGGPGALHPAGAVKPLKRMNK